MPAPPARPYNSAHDRHHRPARPDPPAAGRAGPIRFTRVWFPPSRFARGRFAPGRSAPVCFTPGGPAAVGGPAVVPAAPGGGRPRSTAHVAVVTLSDTRTTATDASRRPGIADLLTAAGHRVADRQLLPDDPAALGPALIALLARHDVDAIVTTGGTGVGRRDQTIDVVDRLIDVPLPGFGELFRMLSYAQVGSGAMLSRAVGGVAHGKVIFALPGSPAAVELAVTRLILPELPHLLRELRK